ncbi:MAG: hypothetical protein AAFV19_21270 [Pseudomonadota bacterium]
MTAASGLLCIALGTVHAFSVLLTPLEELFGASRSAVSLTYSVALFCLTAAVLFGPRVFHRMTAPAIILGAALTAAFGAILTAFAPAVWGVWLGYGVVFGAANGIGYGFGLQVSAAAAPGREGLVMGIVTACYAIGAALAPGAFLSALTYGGITAAILGLAAVLAVAGIGAVLILSGCRIDLPMPMSETPQRGPKQGVAVLRLAYGAGVAAGLMVIGHAAEIARSADPGIALWLAPTLMALANMVGSLTGGILTDRAGWRWPLLVLPLASALALCLLLAMPTASVTLAALAMIGGAYGAIIAVYPAAIAKVFGIEDSAAIYGRVFIAWGAAGLAAPWLAGLLFDQTGGYASAIGIAVLLSFASTALVLRLPRTV